MDKTLFFPCHLWEGHTPHQNTDVLRIAFVFLFKPLVVIVFKQVTLPRYSVQSQGCGHRIFCCCEGSLIVKGLTKRRKGQELEIRPYSV